MTEKGYEAVKSYIKWVISIVVVVASAILGVYSIAEKESLQAAENVEVVLSEKLDGITAIINERTKTTVEITKETKAELKEVREKMSDINTDLSVHFGEHSAIKYQINEIREGFANHRNTCLPPTIGINE